MRNINKKFPQFEASFLQFALYFSSLTLISGYPKVKLEKWISISSVWPTHNSLRIRADLQTETDIPIVDRYKNNINIKERRKTFTKSYQFNQFDQDDRLLGKDRDVRKSPLVFVSSL